MKRKDGLPWIWPSWISKIIGGDAQCAWAGWVKARYWYRKRPDANGNQLSNWKAEHAKLVREHVDKLRAESWTVSVEDQNKFDLQGKAAVLGGKPDIVASKGYVVMVVDVKGGRRSDADFWQVVIYVRLLPKVFPGLCKDKTVIGRVQYREDTREITAADVAQSWPKVVEHIDALTNDTEPAKVPSERECRYCDIDECPSRVVANVTAGQTVTDDF